jgi:hypothetical protein
MKYEQFSVEDQDDFLAVQLYGREREHFDYDFNRRQFEALLPMLAPGPELEDIKLRLDQTNVLLAQVGRYITALRAHIRSPEAHAAALARVELQRKAGK